MPVLRDPAAQEALLWALAQVHASRQGAPAVQAPPAEPDGDQLFGDADPELAVYSLAEIAVILARELDAAGGDSAAVLRRVYLAVTPVDTPA
jgi:hypothetical protein